MEKDTSRARLQGVVGLKTGCHYWYRHKHEMIWRICYIGIDHDDNQWLHRIDSPASQVSDIDLGCFDWKTIDEPKARPDAGCTELLGVEYCLERVRHNLVTVWHSGTQRECVKELNACRNELKTFNECDWRIVRIERHLVSPNAAGQTPADNKETP